MKEFIIRQGDQCELPFPVIIGDCLILDTEVDMVEITVEEVIQKTLEVKRDPETKQIVEYVGDVVFDRDHNTFNLPITQTESNALEADTSYATQVRVWLHQFDQENQTQKRLPAILGFEGPKLKVVRSLSGPMHYTQGDE